MAQQLRLLRRGFLLLASVAGGAAAAFGNPWSWVRGVNYIPSGGPSWDFFPSDQWNRTTVTREMGWAAQVSQ